MPAIPPDHRLDAGADARPFHMLAEVARRQPDGVLVLSAGAGLVLAGAALAVDAVWAPLALPAAAAAAFGGWGILDRTVGERRGRHDDVPDADPSPADRFLGALGALLGVTGWLALGAFLFLAFGRVFDGWIH